MFLPFHITDALSPSDNDGDQSPHLDKSFFGVGGVGEGAVFTKKRPFPHQNKKGRQKENSSGRAAPQGSPALPARLCVGRR